MGDDLTTYSVSATSSGNFTLSLTVYDQGGLSSTSVVEFDIHNRVPTASLAIDGIAVLDGEEIRLKTPSNTLIDLSLIHI